jgi:hypothetical protein
MRKMSEDKNPDCFGSFHNCLTCKYRKGKKARDDCIKYTMKLLDKKEVKK